MIRLNRQDIDIPAGLSGYTVRDSYTLPVPVTAFGVQPHAHSLAREVRALATLPDGTTKWLLYIREWDFHWQDAYHFAVPLSLPVGTRLSMEITYDNSEANAANSSRPPRRVTYGQRTSDEMGDLWIQVVPDRRADATMLVSELQHKLLPQTISGFQLMSKADPDNVGLHDDLGVLLSQAGDFESAATQFTESLRLRPDAPAAHYNVGNALLNLRRWPEAASRFREALALSPDYGLAHEGLAKALQAEGQYDDALRSFESAVRLTPTAEVHYNFGVLQQAREDFFDALAHYREAVRLNPMFPEAHSQSACSLCGVEILAKPRPHSNGLSTCDANGPSPGCSSRGSELPLEMKRSASFAPRSRWPSAPWRNLATQIRTRSMCSREPTLPQANLLVQSPPPGGRWRR